MDISPTIKAVSLSGLFLLNACASSNEGFVDYRKAELHKKDQILTCPSTFDDKKGKIQCVAPPKPGQLLRQNSPVDKDARIEKGANLSVHLCSAYIRDFHEPFYWDKKNGEIAVVANVFEMNGENDFDHNDNELKQGRLVFYSPDVEAKQILNFHNMSVYGPKTYSGTPLGIQLAVFELDSTPPELKSVLDFAANAGAKAYPPASPVLKILNGLGKSFLNGDKNDTELKYSMVLSNSGGYLDTLHPVIEAGYYVFVREEIRELDVLDANGKNKDQKWNHMRLNPDTCRLEKEDGSLYTDNTYLVVAINKGESSLNIDLSQNTYGKFLQKLREKRADDYTDLETSLTEVLAERMQTQNFATAKDLIAIAKGQAPGVPEFAMQDLVTLLTDHNVNVAGAALKEKKFTLAQMRYLQSELLNFAEKNGQTLTADDFSLTNIVSDTTKNALYAAVKQLAAKAPPKVIVPPAPNPPSPAPVGKVTPGIPPEKLQQ